LRKCFKPDFDAGIKLWFESSVLNFDLKSEVTDCVMAKCLRAIVGDKGMRLYVGFRRGGKHLDAVAMRRH